MKYVVKAVEEVYDAFDEFEHSNELRDLTIESSCLEEALGRGKKELQEKVNDERRKGGFMSSGTFLVHVERAYDEQEGMIYEKINRPDTHLRYGYKDGLYK